MLICGYFEVVLQHGELLAEVVFGHADGALEEARQAFIFEDTGDAVTLQNTGNDAARGVLFYGMPLGEPIVSHGPFNGNTGADIARYIERYQRGEMGILEPNGRLVQRVPE